MLRWLDTEDSTKPSSVANENTAFADANNILKAVQAGGTHIEYYAGHYGIAN